MYLPDKLIDPQQAASWQVPASRHRLAASWQVPASRYRWLQAAKLSALRQSEPSPTAAHAHMKKIANHPAGKAE
jgi:hypothetical protein